MLNVWKEICYHFFNSSQHRSSYDLGLCVWTSIPEGARRTFEEKATRGANQLGWLQDPVLLQQRMLETDSTYSNRTPGFSIPMLISCSHGKFDHSKMLLFLELHSWLRFCSCCRSSQRHSECATSPQQYSGSHWRTFTLVVRVLTRLWKPSNTVHPLHLEPSLK